MHAYIMPCLSCCSNVHDTECVCCNKSDCTPCAAALHQLVRTRQRYLLPCRFSAVQQLQPPKHVYLCTTSSAQHIAKIVPGQYPTELHESAAVKGVLPRLLGKPQHIPGANGGFRLVEMELLSRGDGWMHLGDFLGDVDAVDAVEKKAMDVLQQLHSCLDGWAVHGDVRSGNVMIRSACNLVSQ